MAKNLYTLPVPSTALLRGTVFQVLPGRICTLTYEYEGDDAVMSQKMVFGDVEAFRCAYYYAVSADMIEIAYDRVVDLEATAWLSEIEGRLVSARQINSGLRHLVVYFDDG